MTANRSAVLHRNLRVDPPVAVRGDGAWIIEAGGRRVFDGCGGAAVSCLGHSHPKVIEAIRRQVGQLAFVHSGAFTSEPAEALARHLVDRAPQGFGNGATMFLGSGSEAMEAALKLARQYWIEKGEPSRGRIIARDMAYHGNTLGALAAGGHAGRRAPYAPLLIDVARIPACHAYRGRAEDETPEDYGRRMADALEAEIAVLGPENVCAFVVEPVGGATMGCVPPAPGYFRRLREICDRHGVLMIADEVMCGMGRTGTLFAMEQEGVTADLYVIAKGLGAGYQPIAGMMVCETVLDAIRGGSGALANGHTYMSHPAACAGALAVLETIEEEGLLEAVNRLGARLRAGLESRLGAHPQVGDIRGRGLFQAFEIVADRGSKSPFPPAAGIAARFKQEALAAGLLCYPSAGGVDGTQGDHVLLAPPFISREADIDFVADVCAATLDRVLDRAAA
ncbi:MAG: aspartate aminotransferase family protein [Pseudomonadota bacterium]